MDRRRQVGSGRVCVKLSSVLESPYSLSGWLMGERGGGLGEGESGLRLCCELPGVLDKPAVLPTSPALTLLGNTGTVS